jgi:tRNA G26 N,N-dimethylase Trm1
VYLQEEFFDVVDVDSFGSDISFLPLALDAVRFGGLLFLTSTDGLTSGGEFVCGLGARSLTSWRGLRRPLDK